MRKNLAILTILLALVSAGVFSFYSAKTEPTATQASQSSNNAQNNQLTTVAQNLNTPWSMVFYGTTALISSRDTGQILEMNSETGASRVIGVVPDAQRRGEGGLLGLAVDDQKGLFTYHTTATDNRVSRFELLGEPGKLSLGTSKVIIKNLPSASFHNGGRIAIGPDKLLYVTVGDAGDTDSAQSLTKLSGKILRLNLDGTVPKQNPFPNSYVYSYGHRNPQGLAWATDGTMYATEFGQNTWDELNVIKAGSNYGWPVVEGIENREGFMTPVQQWATSEASPSGMTFANGQLYIANLRGERLRTVPINDLETSKEYYVGEYGRIRDTVLAPNGEVWFVTNNTDGRGRPGATDDRIFAIN